MEFQEFLKTRPVFFGLYLLEEWGDREKIEKRVAQFGFKTEGRVLVYNQDTKHISKNAIYKSNRGYTILLGNRKIPYENFKVKEI